MIHSLSAAVLLGLQHGPVVVTKTATGYYVSSANGQFEADITAQSMRVAV